MKQRGMCFSTCPVLYLLTNHIPNRICCIPLHLRCGVGISVQCESRGVVSQRTGQGFHVHAIFELQGRVGVSEIMEADVFGTDGFQNLIVSVSEGIRIIHRSGFWGREHIRISGMFLVFLYQQVYRLLRNGNRSDGVLRLRPADYQFSVDAADLLCDGDGHVLDVQVSPEESQQLTAAQAGSQLQIVKRAAQFENCAAESVEKVRRKLGFFAYMR